MTKLCSMHAFLATPMWGKLPSNIEEIMGNAECEHCNENKILAPLIMERLRNEAH